MSDRNKPIQLDLRLLGAAVFYRWPIVVIPTIILPLVLWIALEKMPKKYGVSARILVQESISVNPFLQDMSVPWKIKDRLPVIQAILISRATLEKTLRHIKEISGNEPPKKLDERIRSLRRQISVNGLGGGLIDITLSGESPNRLHTILVFLVDVLIEAMLRPQKQSLEDASHFLDKQISETRIALVSIENQIEKFKKDRFSKFFDK